MKIVFVFYSLKVRVLIFSLDISSTLFIALKNLRESKNWLCPKLEGILIRVC